MMLHRDDDKAQLRAVRALPAARVGLADAHTAAGTDVARQSAPQVIHKLDGKKFLAGPGNIFLEGSRGTTSPTIQALPGLTDRNNLLPTGQVGIAAISRGHTAPVGGSGASANGGGGGGTTSLVSARQWSAAATYDEQLENYTIITGTPETVIPKIRHVLETLRPGSLFFWDGDGAMTDDDSMRSVRLFGSDVLPVVQEMGAERGLPGPFEVNPADGGIRSRLRLDH